MHFQTVLIAVFLTLLPIFELRGGIPYALANGLPPLPTFIICVLVNTALAPLIFVFLTTVHNWLNRWSFYRKIFDRLIEKARKKVGKKVEKYGYAGIAIFVAIPLPITGVYTGVLGAWVLGMKAKPTFIAVTLGVIVSGTIVLTISHFGIKALSIFIK